MVHILDQLDRVIAERRARRPADSYVVRLLDDPTLAAAKVGEEAGELIDAARDETDARVCSEAADLLFHTLVLLATRPVPLSSVWDELERRFGTSGLTEKAARETTHPAEPCDD
jgi:phosphoribosyl-ATP pyrophosphohydrolase